MKRRPRLEHVARARLQAQIAALGPVDSRLVAGPVPENLRPPSTLDHFAHGGVDLARTDAGLDCSQSCFQRLFGQAMQRFRAGVAAEHSTPAEPCGVSVLDTRQL